MPVAPRTPTLTRHLHGPETVLMKRARRCASASSVPQAFVLGLGVGVATLVEPIVVGEVEMMGLDPHTRHVHRVHVSGETPVGVVDVIADIARAGDDLVRE